MYWEKEPFLHFTNLFFWPCKMVIKIAAVGSNKHHRQVYWGLSNQIKKTHITTTANLPLRVRENTLPTPTLWLFLNSFIEACVRKGRYILDRANLLLYRYWLYNSEMVRTESERSRRAPRWIAVIVRSARPLLYSSFVCSSESLTHACARQM